MKGSVRRPLYILEAGTLLICSGLFCRCGGCDTAMAVCGSDIGLRKACFLLARPAGTGPYEQGQIAKLVGVAPLNRDSCLMRGKCFIAGGKMRVRDALYSRSPTCDPLRSHHLRNKGKPSKVARVAVIRNMIIILNARMRKYKARRIAAPGLICQRKTSISSSRGCRGPSSRAGRACRSPA